VIDEQLSDRLRCVIFGATECKGFALVTFYPDDPDHYSVVLHNASPRTAAGCLMSVADEVDRQAAQEVKPV
jgi:hypothetical protein